jgi:hypothetical protein
LAAPRTSFFAFGATPVDGIEIVPGPLQLLLHFGRAGWRLVGA